MLPLIYEINCNPLTQFNIIFVSTDISNHKNSSINNFIHFEIFHDS